MKLITYTINGALRVGLTDGDRVADLTQRLSTHPATMVALIEQLTRRQDSKQIYIKREGFSLRMARRGYPD